MLRNIKNLQKCRVVATDGAIGSVDQFFFDDERWTIRYLVVDTGRWLPGRRVLISPFSIRTVDWSAGTVSLSITRGMVKSSPDIDTHKPVSRQQEIAYLRHYGYPHYWGSAGLWGLGPYPAGLAANAADARVRVEGELEEAPTPGDSHLRSSKEVIGYHLQATDGELGHVKDFLVEDETWAIRYIVVDTSKWWFGKKKMLVSPEWIREVSWSHKKVFVDLRRESVRQAPEYDSAAHLNRQWEADYYARYRRRRYWTRERDGRP
jgi:hypothetical protein